MTEEEFRALLQQAGSRDARTRHDALDELRRLPREIVVDKLSAYWQVSLRAEISRQKRNRLLNSILFFYLAMLPVLPGMGVSLDLHLFTHINWIFAFIVPLLTMGTSGLMGRDSAFIGACFVLTRLPYPELVPLLIDALAQVRWISNLGIEHGNSRRLAILAALGALLPEYGNQDHADLSLERQQVLLREMERYARRLRDPRTKLNSEESAFLVGLLAYLRNVEEREAAQALSKNMLALMEEPSTAYDSPERQAVREAAQVAYVRLYG